MRPRTFSKFRTWNVSEWRKCSWNDSILTTPIRRRLWNAIIVRHKNSHLHNKGWEMIDEWLMFQTRSGLEHYNRRRKDPAVPVGRLLEQSALCFSSRNKIIYHTSVLARGLFMPRINHRSFQEHFSKFRTWNVSEWWIVLGLIAEAFVLYHKRPIRSYFRWVITRIP